MIDTWDPSTNRSEYEGSPSCRVLQRSDGYQGSRVKDGLYLLVKARFLLQVDQNRCNLPDGTKWGGTDDHSARSFAVVSGDDDQRLKEDEKGKMGW